MTTKRKTKREEKDFIIISDGNCDKCGLPINYDTHGVGMCQCTIWFSDSHPNGIICKKCDNKKITGRQLKCKVCNIRKHLEISPQSCLLFHEETLK